MAIIPKIVEAIAKVHLEMPGHYVKAHSVSLESNAMLNAGGQTVSRSY